jgi:hypothetical protein
MEIVGDERRLDREQPLEMLDRVPEGGKGRVVLEIADVMADPGAAAFREAERVPLLGDACEQRPGGRNRKRGRLREIAAGAADRQAAPTDVTDDRILDPRVDRPIVDEEAVDDAGQALDCVVVEGDRLVGDVAACQHDSVHAESGEV